MADAHIGDVFACSQCGTQGAQRTGRGRRFTKCEACRAPPTRTMAEIRARAVCNTDHTCSGCGGTFKPRSSDRTTFCSRQCAFAERTRLARGPSPYVPAPSVWRRCLSCDQSFEARRGAVTCSADCRSERARTEARRWAIKTDGVDREPRPCAECGVEFAPAYGHKARRYCSAACGRKAVKRTARITGKARKRAATVESVNPTRVFMRDGWLCHLCGGKTLKAKRGTYHPKAPELDHIVPLAKGGEHSYRNTACAHRKCNADKSDTIMGQPSLLAA